MTRLPDATFLARPWRIHELTRDFRLEDVWALPTSGGPDDLPRLIAALSGGDPGHGGPWYVRALWAARWRLGRAYMAAITPFRHLIIYPQMIGRLEREWRRRPASRHAAAV